MGSIPTVYGPEFFGFFFTCLAEKIGSPYTNKAFWKKINAHKLPICIPLCAGWVCSTDLQSCLRLYMVLEDTGGSTRQWSSGMHHVLLILWRGFKSGTAFFAFFVTCLAEKIGLPCTNKACQKKSNAHRLSICIPLCAGWVCSSDLQPKPSYSSQSDGKIVVACTNTPCQKKKNAHRNPMEALLAFNIVICNQNHNQNVLNSE